ncbi:lipid-binding SYLF domain-containing protein [Silvibacterium bohemicum]|uniref:Lipid-binding SYLF domain-containing protein n=1 Tax=Silvibacterium bohemicum TaxID=1577686 RepID=A0A841KAG1_9BACT|nr:lipid-binding SYLF domain-containing protein [Silvibacterium bohemicum]MBB6147294.1 lipid-binding SYLF domain-containing protein [Silvibacterium bohemicum]
MKMRPLLLAGLFVLSNGLLWAGTGHEDSIERLRMSSSVLHSIIEAPDRGIPEEVLSSAKCIVIVPHLVKGGFIIGGEHGRGIATCRTATGWSAPAFISVGGGSWGLQIGVEGVDLVMLIMNDHGFQHLLSSKFQIGGDASASAGPVGRHASADTDWKMNSEILTYSRSKGLFAGITLDGAVVEQDNDSTQAIYGRDRSFRAILSGRIAAPRSTIAFMNAVAATGRASAIAEANPGTGK